ncbi:hypothetical protein EVAR_45648_1 [Eumeta japonica]|uniref:Uncharacterized protein n=1 Tax=Eumeta variegata TaxID=151549 RepID=A0A4C1Y2E0_EUMVA|nr:hypothetical protein EVAR_45648_1 [Eumeta japonica]
MAAFDRSRKENVLATKNLFEVNAQITYEEIQHTLRIGKDSQHEILQGRIRVKSTVSCRLHHNLRQPEKNFLMECCDDTIAKQLDIYELNDVLFTLKDKLLRLGLDRDYVDFHGIISLKGRKEFMTAIKIRDFQFRVFRSTASAMLDFIYFADLYMTFVICAIRRLQVAAHHVERQLVLRALQTLPAGRLVTLDCIARSDEERP